jgi:hypothetical protein
MFIINQPGMIWPSYPGRILPSQTRQLGRDNPDRAKAA